MLRFAVLTHNHPQLHWDFLLESGEKLRTWRLDNPPDADCEILATPLPDHRLKYLDYEGPVGGDRGEVSRWDGGEYDLLEDGAERLAVRLRGVKLNGTATLVFDRSSDVATFAFVTE